MTTIRVAFGKSLHWVSDLLHLIAHRLIDPEY